MLSGSDQVINYLLEQRKVDFSGYYNPLLNRQLNKRLEKTGAASCNEYYEFLRSHPDEIDKLINSLIINTSFFFRDPLVFNYLSCNIFPNLIAGKIKSGKQPLRIWSAGCAEGEEPYSVALELIETLKKTELELTLNIFGTDIDENALRKAREAVYRPESLNNIRLELLKYFIQKDEVFSLSNKLKHHVHFSRYDLMDKNSYSPPESVFGEFDIVMCRNVLIYYNKKFQNRIFDKLYRSLKKNGYLVLGETEIPSTDYQDSFKKINDCCKIYQKIE